MAIIRKRTVFALALTGLIVSMMPPVNVQASDARQLSFYHTHTHLNLDVIYYQNGEYVDSALDKVNRFLKDFRTGDVARISSNPIIGSEPIPADELLVLSTFSPT